MNCDPSILIEASKCFRCISKGQSSSVAIYLLCQWANHLTPAEQFAYTPETELVTWFDTALHTGDLATFRATADIPNVITINFVHEAITSVTGLSALPALEFFLASDSWSVTSLDFTGCNNIVSIGADLPGTLTSLIIAGCASLVSVGCSLNQFTTLDVTGCTSLQTLDCNTCALLTTITGLATCSALVNFQCFSCDITGTLNVSGLANLTTLNCSVNANLTAINVTGCITLATLSCNNCDLGGLDVTTCVALDSLVCLSNPFDVSTALDLSNCTVLNNLLAQGCSSLSSVDMTNIGSMTGSITINSCPSLTTLTTPDINVVGGDVSLHTCPSLSAVSLPACTQIIGDLHFYSSGVVTVSINLCTDCHQVNGSNSTSMTSFSMAALNTIFDYIDLTGCTSLTSVTLTDLSQPIGGTVLTGCTSLVALALPAAGLDTNGLHAAGCTSLTTVSIPNLTSSRDCELTNCALNLATVDSLLALYVTLLGTISPFTIDLSGGTSSTPSAGGLVDKATINAFDPGNTIAITN